MRASVYEIVALLGVGGMGEVYRATDTNLKRQVAIKVLPASVAADTDRLARFRREAEVLASLNHPNIAHIHGLEKSDGTIALVMELVEGPTRRIGAPRVRSRSTRRCRSRGRLPTRSKRRTSRESSIAISAGEYQGTRRRHGEGDVTVLPANVQVAEDIVGDAPDKVGDPIQLTLFHITPRFRLQRHTMR